MAGIVEVISTSFDKAKRLVVKVLYQGKLIDGKGDLRQPLEVSPYGVDSNPIKGKRALFITTGVAGKYYVPGYLNTARLAQPGEFRSFSTDANGQLQAYMWLKNSGNIMELNGNDNWAVKFNELKTEFNKLKTDYNNLVTTFNSHVHVLTLSAGTGTAAPSVSQGAANTSNIDNVKNAKIKTNS